jgi:hypothetical protein
MSPTSHRGMPGPLATAQSMCRSALVISGAAVVGPAAAGRGRWGWREDGTPQPRVSGGQRPTRGLRDHYADAEPPQQAPEADQERWTQLQHLDLAPRSWVDGDAAAQRGRAQARVRQQRQPLTSSH